MLSDIRHPTSLDPLETAIDPVDQAIGLYPRRALSVLSLHFSFLFLPTHNRLYRPSAASIDRTPCCTHCVRALTSARSFGSSRTSASPVPSRPLPLLYVKPPLPP